MNNPTKMPSVGVSLAMVAILILLLSINVSIFGEDALSGSIQVVLLFAAAICSGIAMLRYKIGWKTIEAGIVHHIAGASSAIIMLLLIGALAGTWMLSGVVPAMIYYGLKVISPDYFLVTACIVSAIVSISTGSSWTTIATIGIALMGIGTALGFSEGWTAGAIISGAYFGDKMSPLSDTTNLASGAAGSDLFQHIRYMWITSIPSISISLVVFLVVGLLAPSASALSVNDFSEALQSTYHITPLLFIVPLVTLILILRKVPAIVTLMLSVALASLCSLIFQPHLCQTVMPDHTQGALGYFAAAVQSMSGAISIDTGNEALNSLVATRGMAGMLNTVWLIVCSMCFGGVMEASGMLLALTNLLMKRMKGVFSSVAFTSGTCLFFNAATGDQYISIILPGKMLSSVYKKRGYEPRLLSRTLEDSATVTSVLIPWNSCGMTQSSVLQVSTLIYAPFCIFNWLSPLMTLLVAFLGVKIRKPAKETAPLAEEA